MANQNISDLLKNSGLTDKESAVYLSALELGRSTILEIAEHSGVKRSTVYELIPVMEAKGLINKTKHVKKIYYVAQSPKTVLSILHEKQKRFAEALPQLMGLFNSQENRPKVYFFEGQAEIQQMYEDTLREKQTLFNYTSIIDLYDYMDKKWVERYIKERADIGIKTRIIAIDSPESREWQKTASEQLREIRLIPKKDYDFSADVHIYGNKVIMTTYKSGLFGLLIEDENIAQMQKMAFELMWQAAK